MNPRPVMLVSGNVRPVPGDWPVGGAARQAIKLSRALRLRGVDPGLRYRFTSDNSGRARLAEGAALTDDGVLVRLDKALTSDLLLIEAE